MFLKVVLFYSESCADSDLVDVESSKTFNLD